ncbi:acetylornithine transaminase [Natribacillus halophilus]|uniref:Acetylornithine aminotransferase apoenzyme n=1 Tax=Natribacillus halophilus TaxID=549003 RepID=A0A1G8LHJ4_9BACI|nr:acetylornithine transaminase [Natribacillus halophilus]SDI54917.1 acetylornithine aminotransferase apoenzyme [Natribacillus halophilus]
MATHTFPTYKRWNLTFASAHEDTITTTDGRAFIDFMSGIGTVNMGHNHPDIVKAVEKQLHRGWHGSNFFQYEQQEQVAGQLAKITALDLVFFANSGSEANEAAIKLARKATGRTEIVSFTQSFHGRTYGSMAATGQTKIQEGFAPLPKGFTYAPFNESDQLETYVSEDTAAIVLETIQGEGGVIPAHKAFLEKAEAVAKQHGALLIIDEIQTGMGRTGVPFAYQKFDLSPDIITTAKGLGNGFPVAAMIGKKELEGHFGPGSHGTTFGGNPLAMAAVAGTLQVLNTPGLLDSVEEKSKRAFQSLHEQLKDVAEVTEIRGDGLMIGIACEQPVASMLTNMQEKGLVALPAGEKVIRLLPPLTISSERLTAGLEIVAEAIKETVKTTA